MTTLQKTIIGATLAIVATVLAAGPAWSQQARAEGLSLPSAPPGVPLTVAVDPRVELISIIFRLAGNPEYSGCLVPNYARDLDAHFASVREHPVVLLARKLRTSRGVGYNAPMDLAVYLQDSNSLELCVPLEPWPEGVDKRWRAEDIREFLVQAKDFAEKGRLKEFLQTHAVLYEETTTRARELALAQGHLEWLGTFFGERPAAQFHLVPALVNGVSCYGPHFRAGTNEEFYCVLGVREKDGRGQPAFGLQEIVTVAHEFCHSYVNPHIHARRAELRPAGEKLFAKVRDQMRRQAYGHWETMLNESVVRASVVRYFGATQSPEAATKWTRYEIGRGFLWAEELAALLGEYETNRTEFPRFEAFMPKVVAFFNQTAEKLPGDSLDQSAIEPGLTAKMPNRQPTGRLDSAKL